MKKEEKVYVLEELNAIMKIKGFLREDDLSRVCIKTGVPFSQIYSVATFYSMLDITKKGRHIIRICENPSCSLNGSKDIALAIEKVLKIKIGQTTKDNKFTLEKTSCIGACDEAPAMLIDSTPYTKLTAQKIRNILREIK